MVCLLFQGQNIELTGNVRGITITASFNSLKFVRHCAILLSVTAGNTILSNGRRYNVIPASLSTLMALKSVSQETTMRVLSALKNIHLCHASEDHRNSLGPQTYWKAVTWTWTGI